MTGAELVTRDRNADLDVRDPRGATRPLQFVSPTMPQVDQWNADQAFRFGYAANVIAYRCITLRARAAAAVPLVAGRRAGDASTIREGAAISRLLGPPPGGPAPKLSARRLLAWTHAQKIVTGRYAWEIETVDGKPDGRPAAFWPLATASLRAHPSRSGTEWFRLFEYGPSHDPVRFQPGQVFYDWQPSGLDFRQAESELQAARYDLSLVTMCDRYSLGFLRNSAVPAAIITTTAFPDEASRQRFLASWRAEFRGPDNAGAVALNEVGADGDGPVGESIDVKVLGLSTKDARLVEQRKELVQEIAIALGTPWSKLDASGRTYANADAEDRDWWENTILPDLVDLQDAINMQLADRLGTEVAWFDLRKVRALRRRLFAPLQGSDVPALVAAGVIQRNEVRGELDLDPIEGLDDVEFTTPDPVPAVDPTPAVDPPRSANVDVDVDVNVDVDVPGRRTADELDVIEQRRARIWRANDAVVRTIEERWERSWRRLFRRQEESTLARLRGKRGRQALGYGLDGMPIEARDAGVPIDAEELFQRAHWSEEQRQLADDLFEEAVAAGLGRLIYAHGIDFDLSADWVTEFIGLRSNQLAGPVAQTTYEAIQAELVAGVEAGESIDDLAERIRRVFRDASERRARVIARTEVLSAYNGAATLGATRLPADVVAAQEWISTRDGRTRSAHAAVDGQTVAIGTAFDVGGDQLAYPGDPSGRARNVIQCRCTIAFLTPEEWAEAQGRAPVMVETRVAELALRLLGSGPFDEHGFRRALEGAAA